MKIAYYSFLVFILISIMGCNSNHDVHQKAPLRPNVIFILADDLGYHDL
ncbi:MAG: hypothetical protein ACI9FN_002631, partial [Saprospiraceae bacterium]